LREDNPPNILDILTDHTITSCLGEDEPRGKPIGQKDIMLREDDLKPLQTHAESHNHKG
jgi:hypothetical protein